MSGSIPSFERFDYQLRPNKHIERKLIFDLLIRAQSSFNLSRYGYLGLGSMWFADHKLAHRHLSIEKLLSMEASENAHRAHYNRPFGCISVLRGMSHEVLEDVQGEEDFWKAPLITWMDYDGALNMDVASDIDTFLKKLASGSVLIVTLNAARGSYRKKPRQNGSEIDPRASTTIASILGLGVIPQQYRDTNPSKKSDDIRDVDFAAVLAKAVLDFMAHKIVNSGRQIDGRPINFYPLFNFCHKDGVEMITVGGVICTADDGKKWQSHVKEDKVVKWTMPGEPVHHKLELIPLTLKEKLALDGVIHSSSEEFDQKLLDCGLFIDPKQAGLYREHYRQFPVFLESYL